jgi:L-fucose mutarotase
MVKSGLIHPELLRELALCGHGDKVLIADGNYPLAQETGDAAKIYLGLRAGTPQVTQVLETLLETVNIEKAEVMEPGDGTTPPVFDEFSRLLGGMPLEGISRGDFYRACADPKVRVAISTGEQRVFANILLTIGVA